MVYNYYNLTNITNAGNQTTILTFVKTVNTEMASLPTLMILISIYIVLFIALIGKGFNVFKTFAATSFVMMILTLIVYPMGLISGGIFLFFLILSPLSVFLLWVFGG